MSENAPMLPGAFLKALPVALQSPWRADAPAGDREALRSLIPLIYEKLRRAARQQLRRAPSPRTLQTTALVHEACMRLHHQFRVQFQNKSHFIAVCALLMRQILVGYEREKRTAKRGGGAEKCTLEDVHAMMKGQPVNLLDLDRALTELSHLNSDQGPD